MKIQNLSIIAGSPACNGRCPFCISRMTGKTFQSDTVNWRNFTKACRLAQINNVDTILITGKGEPTLIPDQITEYLKRLKKYNFPIIELQTNGLLFGLDFPKFKPYLQLWFDLGLTYISLSIVSFEPEVNQKIYTPYLKEYIDLEKLIKRLHKIGYSVRLSVTLIKGGLDTEIKIKQMIKKANEWRVEQLTLRKLAIPKNAQEKGVATWAKKHQFNQEFYDRISRMLTDEGSKISTYNYGGEVFDFDGQNVCYTNALTINPESENYRQAIFFPDGHLRFDWQYQGAIIY